ncbi:hypothetical protein LTR40_009427, partial [Exophiala xenobiotica]
SLIATTFASTLHYFDHKDSDPTTFTPTVSLGRVQDGIAHILNMGEPNVDFPRPGMLGEQY